MTAKSDIPQAPPPATLLETYRGKKVLITGNTGFKGAWLSAWLEALGAEVHGLSNDIPTLPSAFANLGGEERFPTAFVDVRDFESVAAEVARLRPEIVFHLAAQALVRPSYAAPIATWGTNVMGTLHVLEAIRRVDSVAGCAIVSSDKCYENLEQPDYAYRETDRLGGRDPYSASKAGAELVFRSQRDSFFRDSPVRLLSFRAGNVLGGGDFAVDRLVPDCMRAFQAGRTATIRHPGATRPWQHVLDPLAGYLLAMARALRDPDGKTWSGESFNFGPSPEDARTVEALVTEIGAALPGFRFDFAAREEHAPPEATYLSIASDKARARIGWRPTLGFAETVRWTVEGYAGDFPAHVRAKIAEFERRLALVPTA